MVLRSETERLEYSPQIRSIASLSSMGEPAERVTLDRLRLTMLGAVSLLSCDGLDPLRWTVFLGCQGSGAVVGLEVGRAPVGAQSTDFRQAALSVLARAPRRSLHSSAAPRAGALTDHDTVARRAAFAYGVAAPGRSPLSRADGCERRATCAARQAPRAAGRSRTARRRRRGRG